MNPVKLFLLAIFLIAPCYAKDSKLIIIAKNNFNASLVALNELESACGTSRTIPQTAIDHLKISNEQFIIAIRYFYFKTHFECSKQAVYRYLLASSALASIDPHQAASIKNSEKLILHTYIQLLKEKIQFATLPDSLQKELSSISLFSRPFNFIKTIKLHALTH